MMLFSLLSAHRRLRSTVILRLAITISALFCSPVMLAGAPDSVTKRILVLGDSLSAAYGMRANDGWVQLLSDRLQQRHLRYDVINSSVSGSTAAGGLQRLGAALEKHQPSIVILELGANDGLQGKPLAHIERNLRTLIEQSQAAGAHVLVAGIRLPPNFGPSYTEPFFMQFKALADEYKTGYVPFLLEGVAGHPELMMADGLHPREAGQPIILETVWPELIKLL